MDAIPVVSTPPMDLVPDAVRQIHGVLADAKENHRVYILHWASEIKMCLDMVSHRRERLASNQIIDALVQVKCLEEHALRSESPYGLVELLDLIESSFHNPTDEAILTHLYETMLDAHYKEFMHKIEKGPMEGKMDEKTRQKWSNCILQVLNSPFLSHVTMAHALSKRLVPFCGASSSNPYLLNLRWLLLSRAKMFHLQALEPSWIPWWGADSRAQARIIQVHVLDVIRTSSSDWAGIQRAIETLKLNAHIPLAIRQELGQLWTLYSEPRKV